MPQVAGPRAGLDGHDPRRRVGPRRVAAQDRPQGRREPGERGVEPGGGGPPGVRRVHGDLAGRPPLREDREQLDLAALAPGVGDGARVLAPGEVRVVHGQRLGVHPAGGHEDDPAGIGRQRRQEQVGHQHRPEDVQRSGQLVPLRRLGPFGRQRPGVVDQAAQREPRGEEGLGERAHRVEVGDVAPPDPRRTGARGGVDLGRDAVPTSGVPHDEVDRGTQGREVERRAPPEAGRRTGDRDVPTGERAGQGVVRPGREPAPHGVAQRREPGCDGAVEGGVERARGRGGRAARGGAAHIRARIAATAPRR